MLFLTLFNGWKRIVGSLCLYLALCSGVSLCRGRGPVCYNNDQIQMGCMQVTCLTWCAIFLAPHFLRIRYKYFLTLVQLNKSEFFLAGICFRFTLCQKCAGVERGRIRLSVWMETGKLFIPHCLGSTCWPLTKTNLSLKTSSWPCLLGISRVSKQSCQPDCCFHSFFFWFYGGYS